MESRRKLPQVNASPGPLCTEQLLDENEWTESSLGSRFHELRNKIKPLFDILGKPPTTALERAIVKFESDADADAINEITLSQKDIRDAENLLIELTTTVENQRLEAKNLLSEVNQYWQELDDREELQLRFSNAYSGICDALKLVKTEYMKRKEEKSKRIVEYIGALRSELTHIWDQCLISDEEKRTFASFYGTNFNEELLQAHREELEKWKLYQEKNQEVLQKAKKREEMWKKLRELDAKAEDPSRFINRGGALLKDQTTHAGIMKSLPKLEAELKKLAERFEVEHGRKVTILGEDIHSLIDREWEKYNSEKSKRKQETRSKVLQIRQSIAPAPSTYSQMGPPASVSANTKAAKRHLPSPAFPSPKQKCFTSNASH